MIAKAAHSIKADYLSSVAVSYASAANDVGKPGFVAFTTPDMVHEAHRLGLLVKPWTPNRLNLISYLLDIGVDGSSPHFPFRNSY
jgi:glycerophosphoryl diester phosphodiesterase